MSATGHGHCAYCSDRRARRSGREAIFTMIRKTPSVPNTTLAERFQVGRQAVVTWRKRGEESGCIPRRDAPAMPWAAREYTHDKLFNGIVYPIGTIWTCEATARVA